MLRLFVLYQFENINFLYWNLVVERLYYFVFFFIDIDEKTIVFEILIKTNCNGLFMVDFQERAAEFCKFRPAEICYL